jgi:hypothetical protein
MRTKTLIGISLFLLCICMVASAAVTRHEAEVTPAASVPDDDDATCGNWIEWADGSASNGYVLATAVTTEEFKFIFQGSGLDLVFPEQGDGGTYDWIVDEGLPSQLTGSGTQLGAGGPQTVTNLVAQGTLDASALHTCRLTLTNTGVLRLDAWDVYDDPGTRIRVEDDDPNVVLVNWTTGSADGTSDDGDIAWSLFGPGATATINFEGNSIAVIGIKRWDGGLADFNIDSGAVTGTISFQGNAGYITRWPNLLANNLGPGPHTCTIDMNAGSAFVLTFDGFDLQGPGVPVELSVFSSE